MRTRLLQVLIASTALLVAGGSPSCTAGPAKQPADPRQILWQRSLDDALQLAAAEQRPLLLAVNMDGESASERIVRELYRDPAFVALTRQCVCVVSSVFRHSPRDFDDRGRRIPCPRLGEVTCGEHMALEPLMFEQFLSDGERVAPRHALIPPSGEKSWDESLAFDLREIERGLAKSLRDSEARPPARRGGDSWADRAAARRSRRRSCRPGTPPRSPPRWTRCKSTATRARSARCASWPPSCRRCRPACATASSRWRARCSSRRRSPRCCASRSAP